MKNRFKKLPSWDKHTRKPRRFEQDNELPYMFHRDVLATPNGQKAWQDFYICHVTHPDTPNFDGHARGRTTHYSLANKVKSKSLCNMLVTSVKREYIDLRKDNEWSGNGATAGCKICTEKAIKLVKEWKKL